MIALSLHISIALSSLFFAVMSVFSPSDNKLRVSGGLIAMTIVSGTYLVMSVRANLTQACLTGLIYTGFMLALVTAAKYRLSLARKKAD